jgi:S-adenosyl methyltransferase
MTSSSAAVPNLAVDRAAAQRLLAAVPEYPGFVLDIWRFVRQAVGAMLEAGIDQCIDLYAGIDAASIARELTRESTSEVRIAYVETDPICVAHLESRVRSSSRAPGHPVDLYAVSWVLDPEAVWRLLDRNCSVGLVMASVLHYEESDDVVAATLRRYHDGGAEGSMLAITHMSRVTRTRRSPVACSRLITTPGSPSASDAAQPDLADAAVVTCSGVFDDIDRRSPAWYPVSLRASQPRSPNLGP